MQTLPENGTWTVTTTNPDSTQQIVEYANGRQWRTTLKAATGAQIAQTTLGYDDLGRLTTSTDSRTGTTTFDEYFDNGLLKKETNPHNDVTVYGRDIMGRVTDIQLPDGSHQSATYTLAGQLKTQTGSQTYPQIYGYDEQGRMTSLYTYQNGWGGTPQVTQWAYNPATGYLDSKTYPDSKGLSYTYTNFSSFGEGAGR